MPAGILTQASGDALRLVGCEAGIREDGCPSGQLQRRLRSRSRHSTKPSSPRKAGEFVAHAELSGIWKKLRGYAGAERRLAEVAAR